MEGTYQMPKANGVCERFMGSLRRECMDHILIHDDKHLRQVVNAYTAYFNQERPHQGIDQQIPDQYELPRSKSTSGRIISKAILGGLHHSYSHTTYLN
jgi:transposase InsO family protein